MDYRKGETLIPDLPSLLRANVRYLRKKVFRPYLKMLCMRLILLYQKYLSRHTCMYRPTCSQYTLECINNHGVIVGILLGMWRILRCNPFSRGGIRSRARAVFQKEMGAVNPGGALHQHIKKGKRNHNGNF